MKAFAGQRAVPLDTIEIDDVGWDRADIRGEEEIVIELALTDLQAIGRYLYARMQECIAEDSDYFNDDNMRGIPLPGSAEFLVEDPLLLIAYFEEPFWSRDAILAVMSCIDAQRDQRAPSHWIQDFRGLDKTKGTVALRLGIHIGPLYLDRG